MVNPDARRLALRSELLDLIETHKEGFASGTPESQRIDAIIDELAPLTKYPQAIDHPEIYRGHWIAVYHNMGRLVGGNDATNQGVGVTASLKTFSMGRMPDVPAQFLGNGLEIDPQTGAYNFVAQMLIGERKVPSHHFSLAHYRRREENLDRFFVDFSGFRIVPVDASMSDADYAAAIDFDDPSQLAHELTPKPKLWSHVAYMDDDLRIQLGQLGGHYVMRRTDLPMYSVEYFRDKTVAPAFAAAG